MEFFNAQDISLLNEYGNQVHKGTLKAQATERELSAGVWAKTKAWANMLATEEFEVECRRSVVKQAGSLPRQEDGRRRMRRTFRPYTWAKLFRPGDEAYKIFFTVGVDGRTQELVWKLDCMRDGTKGLDQRLVARFDEYMKREAPTARWKSVQLAHLERWDWQRLVDTTRQFMEANAQHYDGALEYTWQEHEPGREKLARICWNTLGWQRPSGPLGKSTAPDSHESSKGAGYGAEEWLFDFERLVKGHHYGFLQPINSGRNGQAYAGQDLNIRLFTRNEVSGEYYYVGRIRDAHALTDEEREVAERFYRQKGWDSRMQQELEDAGGEGTVHMGEHGPGPFNIRFRPTDVERPDTVDGLELIDEIGEWTGSKRYKLFNDHSAYGKPTKPQHDGKARVILKGNTKGKEKAPVKRRVQGQQIELAGLHDKVQDGLVSWLKKEYPGQAISKEAYIAPYGTRIDVVRQLPDDGLVFYEVKVLPTIKACIREAIGQLLEYAHWSANDLSQEWVIVSYHAISPQIAEYLATLGSSYGLPITYVQIALE